MKNPAESPVPFELPVVRVPRRLMDSNGQLRLWEFCIPIHIAASGTATLIGPEDAYVFGSEKMIRSATLTFVEFGARYYAITCRHVVDALDNKNNEWRARFKADTGVGSEGYNLYHFYTPKGNKSIHFNFKFWPVPEKCGGLPDVAIAEVTFDFINRLGRRALKITKRLGLPSSAIATGYPEQQRSTAPIDEYKESYSAKAANCFAYLTEQSGRLVLSDSIDDHHGLDNLSGMSGGPMIWSDSKGFGLIGIVTNGLDIIPKDSENDDIGIAIFGEPITYELFAYWVSMMPPTSVLADKSMCFITPSDVVVR